MSQTVLKVSRTNSNGKFNNVKRFSRSIKIYDKQFRQFNGGAFQLTSKQRGTKYLVVIT